MKKLFNFKKSPACEYCAHGRFTPDSTAILCVKKGIMLPSSHCKLFKYDALKRRPRQAPKISTDFSEEDFSL